MATMAKTSERFNIYSNKCVRARYDPEWGRTIFSHNSFYKHAIPTELWKRQC